MGLISCPDCKKDVSTEAPNCPHCGRPFAAFSSNSVQVRRKGGKYEGIGFILILIGLFSLAGSTAVGGIITAIGFIIFLIGRFM